MIKQIDQLGAAAVVAESKRSVVKIEAADTFAQSLIAQGWHTDDLGCVERLQELLQDFIRTNATKAYL